PSFFGSITSRSTRSYSQFLAYSSASSPSYAQSTSMPSCSRLKRIPFTINFSSSTTNIFLLILQYLDSLLYRYVILYFIKYSLFDSLDLHQLFRTGKLSVLLTVIQNTLSLRLTDPGKLHEFLFSGCINIYLSLFLSV